ncbi:cell division protein SepF [Ammoniphilus oxalaticus]|uniref:Cell division protein SepF n=1 Tax=Ammoniphilus oxalaticus TaxID=66863 RepID=A0A419SJ95_9BACL|nr:cell division protein SepF [Ammoniphilus oxalaticus]RKD24114.1 cell division protein SepF [Ammoniphilus oxalaticus]
MGVMARIMGYLGLSSDEVYEEEYEDQRQQRNEMDEEQNVHQKKHKNNVVSLQHAKEQVKMVLVEPKAYEEVQDIADHLRSRRPVIINLQRVSSEQAKRIIDFLSGTIYAINGDIQKVGSNIFMCAPDNVSVQGEITDWLADEDTYMR